jgi:hypothetical protein
MRTERVKVEQEIAAVARQRRGKHVPAATDNDATIVEWRSLRCPRQGYITRTTFRVEAGSITSTVTLRVVGGEEKGSLKSETVKYGR